MKLIAIAYLAQVIPDSAWQVAAQSGFNAVLVLILLLIQYLQRKEDRMDRERDRRAVYLLTRAVTDQTLSMAFLPKQFHDAAIQVRQTLDAEDEKR